MKTARSLTSPEEFNWFGIEILGLTGKKTTVEASSDSASGSGDDDENEG